MAGLIQQFPDACLAIVGDGPQRAELERLFQGLDARFMGYLRGEELAAAYASADAFVYASETETMGNVVLEAMACGSAVVVPRAGGIPNLLSHGTSGYLYRPRDLSDAAQWTRAVLEDTNLRNQVGQSARRAVEERNWEHSVGRVRQIYLEAVQHARRQDYRWTVQQRLAQATTLMLVSAFRSLAAAKPRRRPRSGKPAFRLRHFRMALPKILSKRRKSPVGI